MFTSNDHSNNVDDNDINGSVSSEIVELSRSSGSSGTSRTSGMSQSHTQSDKKSGSLRLNNIYNDIDNDNDNDDIDIDNDDVDIDNDNKREDKTTTQELDSLSVTFLNIMNSDGHKTPGTLSDIDDDDNTQSRPGHIKRESLDKIEEINKPGIEGVRRSFKNQMAYFEKETSSAPVKTVIFGQNYSNPTRPALTTFDSLRKATGHKRGDGDDDDDDENEIEKEENSESGTIVENTSNHSRSHSGRSTPKFIDDGDDDDDDHNKVNFDSDSDSNSEMSEKEYKELQEKTRSNDNDDGNGDSDDGNEQTHERKSTITRKVKSFHDRLSYV